MWEQGSFVLYLPEEGASFANLFKEDLRPKEGDDFTRARGDNPERSGVRADAEAADPRRSEPVAARDEETTCARSMGLDLARWSWFGDAGACCSLL